MLKRSAEEKIKHYLRKILELAAASKPKRRRVCVVYSDSDEDGGPSVERSTVTAQVHNTPVDAPVVPPTRPMASESPVSPEEPVDPSGSVSQVEPTLTMNELTANPESEHLVTDLPPPTSGQSVESTPDVDLVDPELLQALGEFTDDTPEFGEKINENLAKLWPAILKKGLTKEYKEKMFKEYLVPDNCRLLQAPKLNAEISSAVLDLARHRDKTLTASQQQLGFGLAAINRALDCLLKGEDKKLAIHHLSNSCRILSDLHATFTQNRIKLLMPSLDKSIVHIVQDSERDDTLFGNKLSDKIKAAKAIEKQGQQIKKANFPKSSSSLQSLNPLAKNSGNWSAPPRYQTSRGGRGGWKNRSAPPPPPLPRRSYLSAPQQANKPPSANKPRGPPTAQ